jgi:predicted TIM-barrel fold metal-dependent hydrolase
MSDLVQALVEEYHQDIERRAFFDLNVWCDLSPQNGFYRPESPAQILHDLQGCGIHRAVITHAQCLTYDPLQGNESTARLIEGQPGLFGAMVLVPDIILGGGEVKRYIDAKLEQRFVVARLFPKRLYHSMREWQVGEILAYLEQRRLPLMLWHNEVSWDLIEGLCQEYTQLPVIVEGNDIKLLYHNRNYLALLRRCPNLYLETHNLVLYSEIEHLAEIAADRLLFGTYFPYNTPHASLLPVLRARLPEKVKDKLAFGNLERLLEEIRWP